MIEEISIPVEIKETPGGVTFKTKSSPVPENVNSFCITLKLTLELEPGSENVENYETIVLHLNKCSHIENYRNVISLVRSRKKSNIFKGKITFRDLDNEKIPKNSKSEESVGKPFSLEGTCIPTGWKATAVVTYEESEVSKESWLPYAPILVGGICMLLVGAFLKFR
jgi:hypothetical protein